MTLKETANSLHVTAFSLHLFWKYWRVLYMSFARSFENECTLVRVNKWAKWGSSFSINPHNTIMTNTPPLPPAWTGRRPACPCRRAGSWSRTGTTRCAWRRPRMATSSHTPRSSPTSSDGTYGRLVCSGRLVAFIDLTGLVGWLNWLTWSKNNNLIDLNYIISKVLSLSVCTLNAKYVVISKSQPF